MNPEIHINFLIAATITAYFLGRFIGIRLGRIDERKKRDKESRQYAIAARMAQLRSMEEPNPITAILAEDWSIIRDLYLSRDRIAEKTRQTPFVPSLPLL